MAVSEILDTNMTFTPIPHELCGKICHCSWPPKECHQVELSEICAYWLWVGSPQPTNAPVSCPVDWEERCIWLTSHARQVNGPHPQYSWDFREEFWKNSGKTPEMRLPELFQNPLPPSPASDASFIRSGSGEGLSELVMEFLAVLRVRLS